MNIYTLIVNFILILPCMVFFISDVLNIKHLSNNIPEEFQTYYNKDSYIKSQLYLKSNTLFNILCSVYLLFIQLLFLNLGGFVKLNEFVKSFNFNYIISGILFTSIIILFNNILQIPFQLYRVFIIEEDFGFNKMTMRLFFTDLIKSYIINILIVNILIVTILFCLNSFSKYAWGIIFIFIILFEIFIACIAPITIMPLFNKYTPMKEGILKDAIAHYLQKENLNMQGIFIIDGSKRSTKTNAFLTGFWKFKRIVFFDTLIQNHTKEEILSILGHEVGHYKLHHITKNLAFSFISTAVMLSFFALLINKTWVYTAFMLSNSSSIYAGLIFINVLYMPINLIMNIIGNYLSRKYEYQADLYSIKTYKNADSMIHGLKKLSVDNLSNLTPHKFKVFLNYTHPTIINRIQAIQKEVKKYKEQEI